VKQANRITALILAILTTAAIAQEQRIQPAPIPAPAALTGSIASHPDWPTARPADVSSVDAIMAAVYDVISGPKGQARDWNRMRSLFIPDARLIPATETSSGTHADAIFLTIDGYIARSSTRMTTTGFFEHSIHNEVEQYGNIVQVWSTYESRHNTDDPTPFARGINSFQLLKDGNRYWVVNIFWDAETPIKPIPAQYLPK
jgi:hypothetical protein